MSLGRALMPSGPHEDTLGPEVRSVFWEFAAEVAASKIERQFFEGSAYGTERTMKLWVLRPVGFQKGEGFWKFPPDDNPWNPWYDKAFGFVIRSANEEEARKLADGEAGDENRDRPWLDPDLTVCEELTADGPVGIVIRDFASA